ncbi:23916_t:CDS:2 [Cetraspora pellucida]|uniref:23916_t:CDS:1 n=1 Tax=Cetraspora pellucida TaxID=1433469 RepID=A0A9N9FS73_9GLOM|nr:23916_t:CDS:2 [Cetraspora pellucida]
MAVQESATRISQLLPSINCADCGQTVEFRKLGEHICKAAPAVPELPSVYKNSGKRPGYDVSGIKKQTNYSRPNIDLLPATDENLRDNRLLPRSPSPYDATPSPTDSGYSSYSSKYPSPPSASSPNGNKPLLPFMQKYQQTAVKPVNSPSQTSSEQRDRLQNNFNINGSNYSSKFSSNSDNFGSEVMQKYRPHDAYGPSNENRGQRQDRYLRGPNDVYNNDRDHMYREEERSRSRSPAGYDRTNDRADYGSKFSQPSSNQLNGTRDYEQLYKPTYDQQDSKPLYGYVDPGKQHSHKHSQEKNNGLPHVPPLFEKDGKNHRKNENSLSSLNSSASGRVKYPDMNKGISDDSKELFGSGFDDLMEDLMREMDNMQTPTSGHVKNKASSGRKEVHTCAYCNLPIDSSPMWALNKSWHSYHLLCTQCHKPIDPNVGHVERNGKVYCPNDFADLFLPKCRRCHLPVEREAVSASDGKLEGKWHVKCFNCHTCSQPFPDKSFYVFNNAPYCKWHYHKLNNSLCRNCDDPIEGPCAQTVEGWRYHPNFENKQYCEIHIMEIQRKRKIRAEKRRTLFQNI